MGETSDNCGAGSNAAVSRTGNPSIEDQAGAKSDHFAWGEQEVGVFPNPSTGLFTLSLPPDINQKNGSIVVSSMQGRIIKKLKFIHHGAQLFTLDLRDVSSGIYIVQVASGGKMVITRIEKF